MEKIRILIVDDHPVLRWGLKELLNAQPDMEVVGEAADGREALSKAQETAPDVVTLDLTMPGVGGFEVIDELREQNPKAKILILTMHDDPGYLRKATAKGASGYIIKTAAGSELVFAIRAVQQRRVFLTLSDALSDTLSDTQTTTAESNPATQPLANPLSQREQEVFELLAHGHTNKEIADRLYVSVKTIETHRRRIMEKLDLRSRADLVRLAFETGVLKSRQSAEDKKK